MSRKQGVLLGVFAALAAMALWLLLVPAGQEEAAEDAAPSLTITDEHVGNLAAAVVVNDKGMVALYADGGDIRMMDGPQGARLSDTLLKAWFYQMAHLQAASALGQVQSWGDYGLEDPVSSLVLMKKDEGRVRVFLGDESPMGGGRYLRVEGDSTLYLIDGLGMEMMLYGPDDFRDVQVLPQLQSDSVSQITRLCVESGEGRLEITSSRQNGAVLFMLQSPFEAALNWQQVTDKLIVPLASLGSAGFVSDDVPLEQYGFDGPEAVRLEIDTQSGRTVLLFAPCEDGQTLYCAREGGTEVIAVNREDASFLQLTGYELMDSTLYTLKAADVDRVSVSTPQLHGVFELVGQGESLRGSIEGRTLDAAQTVTLYQRLTLLPPAQVLEEGAELSGESLLTLVFERKDGAQDTVQCIPVSDRRCAVVINESASFTTYTSSVEEIIRVAQSAFAGE